MSGVLAVIPARFGSSRLVGKALADLAGAPLVVRVAEMARRASSLDRVVVATDDPRIETAVTRAGFPCEMTGEHPTGTDRVAEVARRFPADIVVNLQGDEPLLDPADLNRLVGTLQADPAADLATLAHRFTPADRHADPHVVKVLVDLFDFALYFSRAPIPGRFPGRERAESPAESQLALRHVGVYGFRAQALERFVRLPRSRLERAEGLEQLRALENGMRIKVVTIAGRPVGVDTPEDLQEVRRLWAKMDRTGPSD